ncbi:ferredoxin C 1, chloroplastic [Mercurialis annua]|uniref:ferredoxin C 1, chloroplastic n=1 Tax=Mercurialis annua TaxID=3986 RepID=UPI00215FC929|nr:ferredoxin C 1, chloroplastic [Mercurialis annua]
MAALHFTPHFPSPSPSFTLTKQNLPSKLFSLGYRNKTRSLNTVVSSYKVVIEHQGQSTELEVEPDESILSKALDSGLDVSYDCKLGVCMTCPAKVISGTVDQSEGMLSDDVIELGYALLCVAYPRSDCRIQTIPEEELLSLQLATAND